MKKQRKERADRVELFAKLWQESETQDRKTGPGQHHKRENRSCDALEVLNAFLDRIKEMPTGVYPMGLGNHCPNYERRISLPLCGRSCVIVSLSGNTGRRFSSLQIIRRIDRRALSGIFIFGDRFSHSVKSALMAGPCGKPFQACRFLISGLLTRMVPSRPLAGAEGFKTQLSGVSL